MTVQELMTKSAGEGLDGRSAAYLAQLLPFFRGSTLGAVRGEGKKDKVIRAIKGSLGQSVGATSGTIIGGRLSRLAGARGGKHLATTMAAMGIGGLVGGAEAAHALTRDRG